MHNLETFMAYAPRGAGLLCAVVYAERGDDVFGWFGGSRGYQTVSAFFLLRDFFSLGETVFSATEGMDLRGGWKYDYSSSEPELARPVALDDDLARQLDTMQGKFAGEWLFYPDDPAAAVQIEAYKELGLPVQTVNVQAKKLNKFDQKDVVWRYYSAAFRGPVLQYLSPRWPLDYRVE
jgi:hypothetical protein